MLPFLTPLLLAAAIDGDAALRHAPALAALGPRTWGSPRAAVAAEYIAAEFRKAGLEEVRVDGFETGGIAGSNVIGVLRAPGPEFVVIGAHHDTAPGAPGAYDDAGGVGVLIELGRVLARSPNRQRTLVFVSFDGEEAWSTNKGTTTGSHDYARSLGAEGRNLVAAIDIEMCGWKGGHTVFHPIPYVDPLRPGGSVVTPAWLMRSALEGAQSGGADVRVGDPLIPWLYQAAVRTYRARLYGDDLSFLQAGLPAVFLSDSSFTAFYPWYHQPSDTPDKLDAAALARMGRAVLGVVAGVSRVPRGAAREPDWFVAFGRVVSGGTLLGLLAASLVPGLFLAARAGGPALMARGGHALLFAVLAWRHPVPALFVFLLPNLLTAGGRMWLSTMSLLPLLALAGLGVLAWSRSMVRGLWLEPWELALSLAALALLFVPLGGKGRGKGKGKAPATGRRKKS
jgi:hypothetical protein